MQEQNKAIVEQEVRGSGKTNLESKVLVGAPFQMMFAEGHTLGSMKMFDDNKTSIVKCSKRGVNPF